MVEKRSSCRVVITFGRSCPIRKHTWNEKRRKVGGRDHWHDRIWVRRNKPSPEPIDQIKEEVDIQSLFAEYSSRLGGLLFPTGLVPDPIDRSPQVWKIMEEAHKVLGTKAKETSRERTSRYTRGGSYRLTWQVGNVGHAKNRDNILWAELVQDRCSGLIGRSGISEQWSTRGTRKWKSSQGHVKVLEGSHDDCREKENPLLASTNHANGIEDPTRCHRLTW